MASSASSHESKATSTSAGAADRRAVDFICTHADPSTWAPLTEEAEAARKAVVASRTIPPQVFAALPYTQRLCLAAYCGDVALLSSMLPAVPTAASRLAVNTPHDGLLPLHCAAANGTAQALELMLRHGADVNVVDVDNGDTALGRVFFTCRWDAVERVVLLATHPAADMGLVEAACAKALVLTPTCSCRERLVAACRAAVRVRRDGAEAVGRK